MTGQATEFTEWVESALAGTGWTAATVRQAVERSRDDLVTDALADGFAAAVRGLAADSGDGAR